MVAGTFNLWAVAGTDTWTGGGTPNFNWNVAANWTGANTPPAPSDTLVFAGGTGLKATNNYTAGTQFNGLFFDFGAGAFTLSGNSLNLAGGITNNASVSETISLPLALTASTTFSSGSGLSLSGVISGGFGVTNVGGTLTLGGTSTYTGGTTINGGTLAFGTVPGAGAGNIRGSLTLNSGTTVNAGGSWNLGYASGTSVNLITNNQGTLTFSASAGGGGTAASVLVLNGGTIASSGGGNTFDWYFGNTTAPTLITVAGSNRSTISANIYLRLNAIGNNLTFNVPQGTTSDGVDLLVSGKN